MIITNITCNDNIYTVSYYNGENSTDIKKVVGKVTAQSIDEEAINKFNLLTEEIKESFWLGADEYLIAIPKMYECLPGDTFIPLGLLRYYITNHMDEECIFAFEIKESEEELNATELQFAIYNFLKWDI